MLRYASVCFLMVVGFVSPQAADAQTGPKRKVHVIVAGLTEDRNIGRSVEFNMNQVAKLMENGLADHHRGEVVIIKGSKTNGRDILAAIDRVSPGPNDAIFMYYHGHGAYDSAFAFRDPAGGHYLDIPSGDLMRKDLFDRLRSRKAKLTVLVTETCYVSAPAHPFIPEKAFVPRAAKDLPVVASLLLSHDGYIDINACSKNEFSWNYAPGRGGSFFTDAFVQAFYEAPFPNPAKTTWTQFISAVSSKASGVYKKVRADILGNAERFDKGLVGMMKGQLDQRLAVIQVSLTHSGGKGGPIDDPIRTVGDVRDVGSGLVINERLDAGDPRDTIRRDSVSKAFKVRLEAGSTYVIDLESRDLDPYLRLENDRGTMLMYDDDSAGDLNSRLKFRPAASGTYVLIATTYHPGATGAFTLRVRKESGGDAGGGALRVGGGLNLPIRITGADPKDRVRTSSHHKVVEVQMDAGRTYTIDLVSKEIDPFLRLETAAGTQLAWNDDADGLNSRIEFRPEVSGTYRIICTTYTTSTGDMLLRVTER